MFKGSVISAGRILLTEKCLYDEFQSFCLKYPEVVEMFVLKGIHIKVIDPYKFSNVLKNNDNFIKNGIYTYVDMVKDFNKTLKKTKWQKN